MRRRRSWWGWGYENAHPDRATLDGLAALVAEEFGVDDLALADPVDLEDLDLPAPRVDVPRALDAMCSASTRARAAHALGMGYRDVVRALRGDLPAVPDVVAVPPDERALENVLDWCVEDGLAVTVFGGGTSVVGGVNVPDDERPVVTLSTAGLCGLDDVDTTSRTARILAGTTGPDLEDALREHDLTLRFFPQSWEFSTLGGWIATRAGGHFATRMTHIDELTVAVRAITPTGEWESLAVPSSGAGPRPDHVLLGSEGTLGVITAAEMRLQDRPRFRASASVTYDTFADGCRAVRDIASSGLHPANCRLLDPTEALLAGAGDGSDAVLLLGFESAHHPVDTWLDRAIRVARERGGSCSDTTDSRETDSSRDDTSESWRRTFLRAPYLRDGLVRLGMIVETFETAATWDRLLDGFVDELARTARQAATDATGTPARIAVRLTHAYPDGAAPYFTVMTPAGPGDEVSQWDAVKAAVSEQILRLGGTITHHHAVGRDHQPWHEQQSPPPFLAALAAMKDVLDPSGILNPGVLLPPGEPRLR